MRACGVVVEYNPFHNGHLYHLQKSKELTNADCTIAMMSGHFLQRGEPAIIDKFHRTKAALAAGADIVIELPYVYAVQSSELFAKGAILSLHELGVSSICFGSELGEIEPFIMLFNRLKENKHKFDETVKKLLKQGLSYPKANSEALKKIGIHEIDMMKPNNILGYSYVKTIFSHQLPIKPFTIQRIENDYHEQKITKTIASATSIRNELMKHRLSEKVLNALPSYSVQQLLQYERKTNKWHTWSDYFPYLTYQMTAQSNTELADIQGVDEGIEQRLKKVLLHVTSFEDLIERVKTKRYTYVRLQRMFVHILTNTNKAEVLKFTERNSVPYIRLLGMNQTGQMYLNKRKKELSVPLIANLTKEHKHLTYLDEKATQIYYSILPTDIQQELFQQEFSLPIRM